MDGATSSVNVGSGRRKVASKGVRIERVPNSGAASSEYATSTRGVPSEDNLEKPGTRTDSDQWDLVDGEVQNEDNGKSEALPSCDFPGTYEAAIHDSARMAGAIAIASKSYVNAILSSGVGKAAGSIGAALSNTVNRYALVAAKAAVDKTGKPESKLPWRVRMWLQEKQKIDDAKKRATEAKQARLQRKIKAQKIANGEDVEENEDIVVHPPGQESQRTEAGWRLCSPPDMLDDPEVDLFRAQNARMNLGTQPYPPSHLGSQPDPSRCAMPTPSPYTAMSREMHTPPGRTSSGLIEVFEDLETPTPVRPQLNQRLEMLPTTGRRSDFMDVSLHERFDYSPYPALEEPKEACGTGYESSDELSIDSTHVNAVYDRQYTTSNSSLDGNIEHTGSERTHVLRIAQHDNGENNSGISGDSNGKLTHSNGEVSESNDSALFVSIDSHTNLDVIAGYTKANREHGAPGDTGLDDGNTVSHDTQTTVVDGKLQSTQ